MEVILNATLAGGVSVGSSSDLVVGPGIAMGIGALAGILSAAGFLWLGKWLQEKIGLMDTCGVHNLHGMPGILGGVLGAISAAAAEVAFENDNAALVDTFKALKDGKRTTGEQGWIQLGALGITLVISVLSGALCGYLASHCGADKIAIFTDDDHWEAEDGIEYNLGEHTTITTEAQSELKQIEKLSKFNDGAEDSETERKAEKKRAKKEQKRKARKEEKAREAAQANDEEK